mmetsp:Transcript_14/g.20  ORF Transcript_14/g.20 Transcript_14/m.20 type:complete len:222 (-) Transcript_14:961-1626(-)
MRSSVLHIHGNECCLLNRSGSQGLQQPSFRHIQVGRVLSHQGLRDFHIGSQSTFQLLEVSDQLRVDFFAFATQELRERFHTLRTGRFHLLRSIGDAFYHRFSSRRCLAHSLLCAIDGLSDISRESRSSSLQERALVANTIRHTTNFLVNFLSNRLSIIHHTAELRRRHFHISGQVAVQLQNRAISIGSILQDAVDTTARGRGETCGEVIGDGNHAVAVLIL